MAELSLRAVQKLTCKKRDAWWTVFLVDPMATRLLMVVARFRFITPNGVTWAALFVGLASAAFFLKADTASLVVGALLYHFSFVLDCIDGKLARLKGNGSVFGGWLDYVFDRVRVLCCALALMGGQYLRTDDPRFLLAAVGVVFLDMLRYLDALQIYKMRQSMRAKLERTAAERAERDARLVFMEDLLRDNPATPVETLRAEAEAPVVDLHEQFRDQFPWYTRVRRAMLRTRVRPHLFSGIEFQMFVFIVGPLLGRVLWTTAASAALLMAFELFIMYKFWLSTRDFNRVVRDMAVEPAAPAPAWAMPEVPHADGVPSQPSQGPEDRFPSRAERLGHPHAQQQYQQYDPYAQDQPQYQQYPPYQEYPRYQDHQGHQEHVSYDPHAGADAAHASWFEPYSEPFPDPYPEPPSPQYPEQRTRLQNQPHAQPHAQPWTDGGFPR